MWENDYFNIYSCSPRTLFRYIKELNEAQTVYRFHHEKKAKLFYAEVLQAPSAEPAQDSRLARLLKIINKYTKNSFYLNDKKPTAQKVQSEILPSVNMRTLQRDLKDINKAMDMLYEYAYENNLI